MYKFLERTKIKSDIIFADPPYDFTQEQFEKVYQLIFENELLEDDGLLIIEQPCRTNNDGAFRTFFE